MRLAISGTSVTRELSSMDRPRDSIAAVVRSRHDPAGGEKFTTGRAPQIVRSQSLVVPLLLHSLKEGSYDDDDDFFGCVRRCR